MKLYVAVPENIAGDKVSQMVGSIRNQRDLDHYTIQIVRFPPTARAVFDPNAITDFIKDVDDGKLAFVPFADGGIHFAHAQAIAKRPLCHHIIIEIGPNGAVSRTPLELKPRFLNQTATCDHVWDETHHYMRHENAS